MVCDGKADSVCLGIAVYSVESAGNLGDAFVRDTTNILHQLADVSRKLDETMSELKHSIKGDLPHMFRRLMLLYHHVGFEDPMIQLYLTLWLMTHCNSVLCSLHVHSPCGSSSTAYRPPHPPLSSSLTRLHRSYKYLQSQQRQLRHCSKIWPTMTC